jgi:GSCFA family
MEFSLITSIPVYPFKLSHKDKVFMAGSCFSENISECMLSRGFHVLSNPWGVIFNPISLADELELGLGIRNHLPIHPVRRDGVVVSLFQHSRLYGHNEIELGQRITETSADMKSFLSDANVIILTFGTAHVYEWMETASVVANCQKQAATLFRKRLLDINEIVDRWSGIIQAFPDKKFVFTISPVRHKRDGLHENNVSKGILHAAVDQLIRSMPNNCFYFPAYEIVLDELRDYRFYKEDLVHPNELAVKYVWEKWSEAMYDPEVKKLSQQFNNLYQRSKHRPMFENTDINVSNLEK